MSNNESVCQKERVPLLNPWPFRKLICNLLLDLHPICINRWSHPLCAKFIHQFYLNFRTIYLEYKKGLSFRTGKYLDKYDVLSYSVTYGNILIFKWCLKNATYMHNTHFLTQPLQDAAYYGHLEIVKLLIKYGANVRYRNHRALRCAKHNNHLEIVKLLEVYKT